MSQAGQFYRSGILSTLTGDVGGAIGPAAGNIHLLGGPGVTVTGNPATSTLTITTPTVVSLFTADAGAATPVAGELNILGGTNISTTGAGNTITVNLDDPITLATVNATTFDTNVAAAGVTLSGTSLAADGTDANIDVTITTKGTGAVVISDNLDVVGTVQLQNITNGLLISDATGLVTASAASLYATGFATWIGAGNYYDDSVLGDFEVLRGGTGYIKGVPVSWAGAQTETGMTAGNTYYIYIDDTGTIGKTTTGSLATFEDYIVLFECLRDSTGTNVQYHSTFRMLKRFNGYRYTVYG